VPIARDEAILQVAEQLEKELTEQGIEVLVDDRDERPGVKFKDGDLWGIPIRIAIGKKGLAEGKVEWKLRNEKEMEMVSVADVIEKVKRITSY
jgi:prolyl-tRNA synthetase